MSTSTGLSETLLKDISFFAQSTLNVFKVMVGIDVEVDEPTLDEMPAPEGVHATSVIGLQSTTNWNMTVSFPVEAGKKIAARLFQIPPGETLSDDETIDAMGELANMIGGGAKASLSESREEDISLGLPTVVVGQEYSVKHPQGSTVVNLPFRSEFCDFCLKIIVLEN